MPIDKINKNYMKIAFDLDDVLINTAEEMTFYFNRLHGTSYTLADHTDFGLHKVWRKPEDYCRVVCDDFLSLYIPELCPYSGAKEALEELSKNGYELAIISSRPSIHFAATEAWIAKHFPSMKMELHLAGQKNLKILGRRKSEICKSIGADYIVDDAPHHIDDCSCEGISCFLWDRPWNQNFDETDTIKRVKSYDELINFLKV
jgi:5'(3')-deoxyribonucleotidase